MRNLNVNLVMFVIVRILYIRFSDLVNSFLSACTCFDSVKNKYCPVGAEIKFEFDI